MYALCVCPPFRLIKAIHIKITNQTNSTAFQFLYKMSHEFLPKKSKVMLYLLSCHTKKHLTSWTLLTRRSTSVLKVGVPDGREV